MCVPTLPGTGNATASSNDAYPSVVSQAIPSDDVHIVCDKGLMEQTVAPALVSTHTEQQPSSLRANTATQQVPLFGPTSRPRTPARTPRRYASDSPEPPETPSFARSLHLFDASVCMYRDERGTEWMHDLSIYKRAHGDEEADRNSLCRPCFRQRGMFSRLMPYGYETCGCEERLDSHYWQASVSPNC